VDILEGAREAANEEAPKRGKGRRVAEPVEDYSALSQPQIAAKLKTLETRMYQHARDLEFEDAARLRDEIQKLKTASLVV
jgi:excinuclease ABC subunit B